MSLLTNCHLFTLSLGHFSVDTYARLLPLLWPAYVVIHNLDYGQVSFAAAVYTGAASLSQPFFGWLGDRHGGRWLGALGVAWIAVCATATALAPDFNTILLLVLAAGLGSAAFHPQGAVNTLLLSGRRAGLGMALFMFGGGIGYALGPVLAAYTLASPFGLGGIPWLAAPGLLLAVLLYRLLSAVDRERAQHMMRRAQLVGEQRISYGAALLVILAILARSWLEMGVITYLPLLYLERGMAQTEASQMLFLMIIVEVSVGVLGGAASDRFGHRPVLVASFLLAAPALLGFLALEGLPAVFSLALLGAGIGATVPITTVMGQELLPLAGVAISLLMREARRPAEAVST